MIRELSGGSLYSHLMILRGTSNRPLVVVEGGTDARLFKGIVAADCEIVPANGRQRVIDAMTINDCQPLGGVVAVVDADFDRLLDRQLPSGDVLITDGHDIDIMLYRSAAFEKFLRHWAVGSRVEAFLEVSDAPSCGEVLIANAAPLGALRLLSLQERLDFDFDRLRMSRIVEESTLQIDLQLAVDSLLQQSGRSVAERDRILQEVERLLDETRDRFHDLAVGHDVSALVAIGLRRTIGNLSGARRPSAEEVERALRTACEGSDFENSQLHRQLCLWEQRNPEYRLLDH